MDGDGDMDIVSPMNNDNIAWWENDGNAEPSWQVHYLPHNLDTGSNLGASHVHAADMDGDGDMDILASFHNIDAVVWFENDGSADPTFTVVEIATHQGEPSPIFAADMDGDGDMDFLTGPVHGFSSGDSDEITWYENDGNADPTWTAADIDMDEVAQVRSVIAADMDGDGDMDIVAALGDDDTFAWYENDGNADPSWTAANIQTGVDSAFSVFAEDMDGDGDMDIVSASYTDNTIAWHENDGNADPSWTTAEISVGFSEGPYEIFVADIDSDGDMDIVSASSIDDTVAWFENDGNADPTWAAENISTDIGMAVRVSVADMDGDGDMDVVSYGASPKTLRLHEIGGTRSSTAHWSISPSLPEGLSLNSTTGEITGTPTEVMNLTDYKVTLTGPDLIVILTSTTETDQRVL